MTPSMKLTLEEEEQLVDKVLQGDGEAFGQIYDAYGVSLYRTVIFPRLRDEKAAEEVLQETFLLAMAKLKTFSWRERSIFFWLRMIAINKCREWVSNYRRNATVDESVLEYQPDVSFQPETEVVREDYQDVLRKRTDEALLLINERYAAALSLRLKDNLSREDAAKSLGVSIETFDVVFFRACKSFREAYTNKFGKI